MRALWTIATALAGAVLLAQGGCGAPGLPPAGPSPGDVEVGYGTQPEGKVTGAVTSITEDDVKKNRPLTMAELLRGQVAGLQVVPTAGGGYSFRIRGTNSLLADQEPLFIVDGIPIADANVPSALAGIQPENVRQIDVLKDVSSTSIYGSRGAGGVILITTRR